MRTHENDQPGVAILPETTEHRQLVERDLAIRREQGEHRQRVDEALKHEGRRLFENGGISRSVPPIPTAGEPPDAHHP